MSSLYRRSCAFLLAMLTVSQGSAPMLLASRRVPSPDSGLTSGASDTPVLPRLFPGSGYAHMATQPPGPSAPAPTPDAEIDGLAQTLGRDKERIFRFVRDEIRYEAYEGILRGALGTLWSRAGNAADKSVLLAALLRAAGEDVTFVSGTLDDSEAHALLDSMFPAPYRIVGCLPDGTPTANPHNDATLMAEARRHVWIEASGAPFDASVPWAEPGLSFASPERRVPGPPAEWYHTLRVSVTAEIKDNFRADATVSTVLDRTFRTADIAGRPLTIGHVVSRDVTAGSASYVYTPYVMTGANDASIEDDDTHLGTSYTENKSALFSLANRVVLGATAQFSVTAPDGTVTRHERTLVDRVGYAARARGGRAVADASSDDPAFLETDVFSTLVLPGTQAESVLRRQKDRLAHAQRVAADSEAALATVPQSGAASVADRQKLEHAVRSARYAAIATAETVPMVFAVQSDAILADLERGYLTRAYYTSPRLLSTLIRTRDSVPEVRLDLRKNDLAAFAYPGQNRIAPAMFEVLRGYLETALEAEVLTEMLGRPAVGVLDAFDRAPVTVLVTLDNVEELSSIRGLSDDGAARIRTAVAAGKVVLLPSEIVNASAWMEVDTATGHTIGVTDDGGHQAITESGLLLSFMTRNAAGMMISVGAGFTRSVFEFFGQFLARLNEGEDGLAAAKAAKQHVQKVLLKEVRKLHAGEVLKRLEDDALTRSIVKCSAATIGAAAAGSDAWMVSLSVGACVAKEVIKTTHASLSWRAVDVSVIVGLLIGLRWLQRNLPEDPPVFPFLSSDLGQAPPAIDPSLDGGHRVALAPDPLFTDDFGGVATPSVFTLRVQNGSAQSRTFTVRALDVPAGFVATPSVGAITIPGHRTGEVGMCVRPLQDRPLAAGQQLAVGASVTDSAGVEQRAHATVVGPAASAVSMHLEPDQVVATPGAPISSTLVVRAAGDVTTTVALSTTGAALAGLPPTVDIAPGETKRFPVVLAVVPAVAARVETYITGMYCATGNSPCAPEPSTVVRTTLRVLIRPGEWSCLYKGLASLDGTAAASFAEPLASFGRAAEEVVGSPALRSSWERARVAIDTMKASADAAAWPAELSYAAVESALAQRSVSLFIAAVSQWACEMSAGADQLLGVDIAPSELSLTSGETGRLRVPLRNPSDRPRTVQLAVSGLPTDVNASVSLSTITLAPYANLDAPVEIIVRPTSQRVASASLRVSVTEGGRMVGTATAMVSTRMSTADVLTVHLDPAVAAAGTPVRVTAGILYRGAVPLAVVPHLELLSPQGVLLNTWSGTPITLLPGAAAQPVDLGTVSPGSLAPGPHTLRVGLRLADGVALPGIQGSALLMREAPFTASATVAPMVVQGASATVQARIDVDSQLTYSRSVCTGGRVVVGHDTNTLSTSAAGDHEVVFATRLATYLTEGRSGRRVLLLDSNPADTTRNIAPSVVQALRASGFDVTVATDYGLVLNDLLPYDALFVDANVGVPTALDNASLLAFVQQGGGVYLAGGVAPGTNEAAAWRAFLEPLGMAFVDGYNGLYDSGPLTVDSPLFRGLPSIGAGNGQSIRMTGTNLNSVALHRAGDEILYAAYQDCGRRPLGATKKWEWRGSAVAPAGKELISTPLVANMNDDNGDGQIDARDVPDVVFVTTQHLGGGRRCLLRWHRPSSRRARRDGPVRWDRRGCESPFDGEHRCRGCGQRRFAGDRRRSGQHRGHSFGPRRRGAGCRSDRGAGVLLRRSRNRRSRWRWCRRDRGWARRTQR